MSETKTNPRQSYRAIMARLLQRYVAIDRREVTLNQTEKQ